MRAHFGTLRAFVRAHAGLFPDLPASRAETETESAAMAACSAPASAGYADAGIDAAGRRPDSALDSDSGSAISEASLFREHLRLGRSAEIQGLRDSDSLCAESAASPAALAASGAEQRPDPINSHLSFHQSSFMVTVLGHDSAAVNLNAAAAAG